METGTVKSRYTGILLGILLVIDLSGVAVRGIPLSLPVLAAAFVAFLIENRGKLAPPAWLLVAFLAVLSAGLIPLSRGELLRGLREIAQFFVMLGGGWMIFASINDRERRIVSGFAAVAGAILLVLMAANRHVQADLLPLEISPTRSTLLLCLTLPFIIYALSGSKIWKWPLLVVSLILFGIVAGNAGLLLVGSIAGVLTAALSRKERFMAPAVVCSIAAAAGIILSAADSWDVFKLHRPSTGNLKRLYIEYQALPRAVAAAPLRGHGLGQYRDVIKDSFTVFPDADDNRIAPDTNSAYQVMAVEAGLPATVLFVVFLCVTAGGALAAVRKDGDAAPFAAAAVAVLLAGLFTPVLTRHSGVLLAMVLGGAASFRRKSEYSAVAWLLRAVPVAAAVVVCAGVAAMQAPSAAGGGETVTEIEVVETSQAAEAVYILIEAEDIIEPSDRGELGAIKASGANDASFNCALTIPLGAGKGEGHVNYAVEDLPEGTYTLWIRSQWTDGCSNSIGLIVGDESIIISDELFKRWHWVAASRPIHAPGGKFRFSLKNLEDGVSIDQILLTPGTQFVPHGIMTVQKPSNNP